MKQFTAFIFALFFLSFLSGCRERSKKPPSTKATAAVPATETFRHDFSNDENFHESGGNLTMATLIDLVDRYGDNLTWDTFAPYWYEDFSSSDTYSFRYPVNINYDLKLRGASMEAPPEQILLVAAHDSTIFIDIRTESIRDFIATEQAVNATQAAKENAGKAALAHCNTSYDFIDVAYDIYRQRWYVGFWETGAKIAAQTVILDKAGHLDYDLWAE